MSEQRRSVEVVNQRGLHARASAKFRSACCCSAAALADVAEFSGPSPRRARRSFVSSTLSDTSPSPPVFKFRLSRSAA